MWNDMEGFCHSDTEEVEMLYRVLAGECHSMNFGRRETEATDRSPFRCDINGGLKKGL